MMQGVYCHHVTIVGFAHLQWSRDDSKVVCIVILNFKKLLIYYSVKLLSLSG